MDHTGDIRADRTTHEKRLVNLLPLLDREFAALRTPEEIRTCADAVLERFDDVPVRTHILTFAQKHTAECLRAADCYELTSV